ncbi:hypothetical protein ACTID9_05645 [Brevibacillus fluminis]
MKKEPGLFAKKGFGFLHTADKLDECAMERNGFEKVRLIGFSNMGA